MILPDTLRSLRFSSKQKSFDFDALRGWKSAVSRLSREEIESLNEKNENGGKIGSSDFPEAISKAIEKSKKEETSCQLVCELIKIRKSQLDVELKILGQALGFFGGQPFLKKVTSQEYVLQGIRTGRRNLNHRTALDVIRRASENNDRAFFPRLADALKSSEDRQIEDKANWGKVNTKHLFVCEGWFLNPWRFPDFCHFTDEALSAFCQIAFPNEGDLFDRLRRFRQRAKLEKWRKPSVRKVELSGDNILFA